MYLLDGRMLGSIVAGKRIDRHICAGDVPYAGDAAWLQATGPGNVPAYKVGFANQKRV